MAIIGLIGSGNMSSALARAVRRAFPEAELLFTNRTPGKAEGLALELSGTVVTNQEAARRSQWLFLGVKPQMYPEVLSEIAPALGENPGAVLVPMAAGLTLERVKALSGVNNAAIRIMPNTPVSIGEGVILYCPDSQVTGEQLAFFQKMLEKSGRLVEMPERLFDAAGSVSGCGPAFAELFLEALGDGAVACGLPRGKAYELAAQMLLGTARLALESGKHPGLMKDEVTSPGGTTIQGVRALEKGGFRSAVMEAVIASFEKNKTIG